MHRPLAAVLVASVLVVAVIVLVVWSPGSADPGRSGDPGEAAFDARIEALSGEHEQNVARLEARIAQLEAANARLEAAVEKERARNETLNARIASAAERIDATAVAPKEEVLGRSADLQFDFDATVDAILDRTRGWSERQKHWKALGEHGRIDDAVAEVEVYARANPLDADVQATLGDTYIQKLVTVTDIEKGSWTKKADAAYDKALAIDDHHWGARFAKAINYSYHPPVFGLQPKAIEQFEILRAQQEERAPEPRFAETYVLLGNLYADRGNDEKAKATWSRGLELFPRDDDLQSRLSGPSAAR